MDIEHWFSNGGDCAPLRDTGHLTMSEDTFDDHNWEVLLSFSGLRTEMLLSILQCTRQTPLLVPHLHRSFPCKKLSLTNYVNSAGAQKSCCIENWLSAGLNFDLPKTFLSYLGLLWSIRMSVWLPSSCVEILTPNVMELGGGLGMVRLWGWSPH